MQNPLAHATLILTVTPQVVYFSKYARGNKIRMNFYMRSSLNR